MYKKISEKLNNKKIAILGFGREGQSTYKFIKKNCINIDITIIDKIDFSNNELVKEDKSLHFIHGDNILDNLEIYDLIIKTPGITLKDIDIEKIKDKITSQLELLLEVYKNNIIGITGTKGKSTTASLLYKIFKDQNKDVFLSGNIGIPVLDMIEEYKKDSILIIEMSSHQLEFIKESPHIGVILNLFQDHLDHAGDLEHYHNNKMNILKFQTATDIGLYSSDNKYLEDKINNTKLNGILYDIRFDNTKGNNNSVRIDGKNIIYNNNIIYTDNSRKLIGDHNLKNIMFVATIACLFGLDKEQMEKSIYTFEGLKYRMECIGTFDDITYYNDTIATIPEATISAINSLKTVDTLIFGGMDRKINYDYFIEFLINSNINNFICMPTTGNTIGNIIKEKTNKNTYFVKTLEESYSLAKEITKKDHIVLLSPAAASYEFFKNFEEKGKCFEDIVKNNS